jgi:processive 1,2-diacylglycerol beta-glucosyltransferase
MENCGTRRFQRLPDLRHADLIVCTHFLCARILSRMRAAGLVHAPIAVVVTDEHPHAVWRIPNADLFLVASEAAARTMTTRGHDNCIPTGIPIIPRFDTPRTRAAARTMRGLPASGPIILVTGGGLGLGGLYRATEALLHARTPATIVVVCGRNEALRRRLRARTASHPNVRILGYTRHMHDLMAASDLIITKPGGLTTAEALALRIPMVLLRPIPGQEERNASALVSSGAAVLHRDPFHAGLAAAAIINDIPVLTTMTSAAVRTGKPDSARRAAEAILSLLPVAQSGPVSQQVALAMCD